VKLTGPLPAATTYTFTGNLTFNTNPQTYTINIPATGLAKGFYNIELEFVDPTVCGPSRMIKRYTIMILNPGESPCIVWPGDMDNDGACNLGDRETEPLHL
jgi:hypothetical protein